MEDTCTRRTLVIKILEINTRINCHRNRGFFVRVESCGKLNVQSGKDRSKYNKTKVGKQSDGEAGKGTGERRREGFSFPRKIGSLPTCFFLLPFTPDSDISAVFTGNSGTRLTRPRKKKAPWKSALVRSVCTRPATLLWWWNVEERWPRRRTPPLRASCTPLFHAGANVPARHLDTVPVSLDWTAICTSVSFSPRSCQKPDHFLSSVARSSRSSQRVDRTIYFPDSTWNSPNFG